MTENIYIQFFYMVMGVYAGWITSEMIMMKSYRLLVRAAIGSVFVAGMLFLVYSTFGWL